MGRYFLTPEASMGTPFTCYVCNKQLIEEAEGQYNLKLKCPRCKTEIDLKCRQPLNRSQSEKSG